MKTTNTKIIILWVTALLCSLATLQSCRTVSYGWYVQQAKVEHVRQTPDSTYTDFFLRPVGKMIPLDKDSIREDGIITTMVRRRIPR